MKSVKQTDILTGSIPKQLLLFFLPIWFGTLFQQLYNTADTLIVGNFVGTNALAAVGATGPFVNLLVGLFVGLCSGAGVVIAQSWGAHDPDAVDRQVHTASSSPCKWASWARRWRRCSVRWPARC